MAFLEQMGFHAITKIEAGEIRQLKEAVYRTLNLTNSRGETFQLQFFTTIGDMDGGHLLTDREKELTLDLINAIADRDTERARAEAAEQELRDLRAELERRN